ncbi:MAG: transketolase, partial [Deltaproteobacteria bacterium]|nr:transketolase [Deltaproteobacteria bacterium]
NGKIPYFNTLAVFLTRRCYEQTLLDAGMHNLNIRLLGSGGGLVYAPLGATHLAFEDIAIMSAIPNMTVLAPCDAEEMKRLIPQTLEHQGPIYIRLMKGGDPVVSSPDNPFEIGKAISMREGSDVLLVATGVTLKESLDSADELSKDGVSVEVLHYHTLKPFDAKALLAAARGKNAVVSVEEHTVQGGLGSSVAMALAQAQWDGTCPQLKALALPDVFPSKYGSQDFLLGHYGLKKENITEAAKALLKR